jgi:MFS family permease
MPRLASCLPLLHAVILTLGCVNSGYTMGFSYPSQLILNSESIGSRAYRDWFTSSTSLAAILGSGLSCVALRFATRRAFTFAVSVLGTASWLLFLGFARERLWLGLVFRALSGVTIGAFSAVIPIYLVEMAPPESTGFYGALAQAGIAAGDFLAYALAAIPGIELRTLAGIGAIPTAALALLVWAVPHSPAETARAFPFPPSLLSPNSRRDLLVSVLLSVYQQTTGVNIILVFNSNFHTKDVAFESSLPWLAQFVAVVAAAIMIDKIGRRAVWAISLLVTAVADGLFSIASVNDPVDTTWFKYGVIHAFMLGYGLGAGPIPLFFVAERFAAPIRAQAMAIILCVNWTVAFGMIRLCAEYQSDLSGWIAFLAFALASVVAAVFGFFFVRNPEEQARAGQKLHEEEDLYRTITLYDGTALE